MSAVNVRFRSLWLLAGTLPVLAGIVSAIVESAIHTGRACGSADTGGLGYDVVFLALALLPGVVVGLVGWRSQRNAADTVGPFVLAMCLSVFLVFIGLTAAWGGHGCMV